VYGVYVWCVYVYRFVLPDQSVFGFCDLFYVITVSKIGLSVKVCLSYCRIRVFCSGSLGNVLFFYGDHVFPFVSDMWRYVPLARSAWSAVGRGLPDHDQQRSNRLCPTVKPEAPRAVVCS
jgi:hypothetical protein